MSQTVLQMATDIVVREGGLSDDRDDRGGLTNHGVSLKYLRGKGLVSGDLNHDGVIDKKDILLVSPPVAVGFFVHDFFESPQFDLLPECLHVLMFDAAVNSGPGGAGMILQKALNGAGYGPLTVDGGCGQKTRTACEKAHSDLGDKGLVKLVVEARVAWLYAIAEHDPSQKKYVINQAGGKGGWITRAESFLI